MNEWNIEFFDRFKFEGLTYDDISFKPAYSEVVPSDTTLETTLTRNIRQPMPLVSANMDTVTEAKMAIEMAKLGGIGILWKGKSIEEQEDWVDEVKFAINARIDNPITIYEDQRLENVLETLGKYGNKFSTLVVLDNSEKVVGLITDDRTQFAQDLSSKVKDFMLRDPVTIDKELDLNGAYAFMKKKMVPKLILTDTKGKVKGMYCWKDVRDIIEDINPMYNRDNNKQLRVGADVGVGKDFEERAERLLQRNCDVLVVSTAHGHSKNVIATTERLAYVVEELRKQHPNKEFDIIAGNVATYEGAKALCEAGADCIKVGIGPGSICTTRIVSGTGVPQISAINDAWRAASEYDVPIMADGGVKYSGHLTKACIAGANTIMLGRVLAGTDESPGEMVFIDGERYIEYRGMGSLGAMKDLSASRERYSQRELHVEKLVPEGVEAAVPYVGHAKKLIHDLLGGLQSGLGYAGAERIEELPDKAKLIRVTNVGLAEAHPHDVKITKEAPNYRA